MDLLLLGHEGGTVYSGPLRLTTPYFLSIGLGSYGAGLTQESLRGMVCSPDASVPFLDGQVSLHPHSPTSGNDCMHRRSAHCHGMYAHLQESHLACMLASCSDSLIAVRRLTI